MYENKCPWDAGACSDAARRGHLECLKYLHENGCPWDKWAYRPVAQGGHVECLQYLRENGCPSGEPMVDSTTSPIQSKTNTNVHSEPFGRAGQRQCRREQVVVGEDQNPRLATAGRVFKHKNVAAVKTKRYNRGSVKSERTVANWPHMQEYKSGHIARIEVASRERRRAIEERVPAINPKAFGPLSFSFLRNPRLATTGRVFKHKNVAAVKAADTKRYNRGSVKSERTVANWPHMQEYKSGHIARVTREDTKEVLNDISNVNQPRQQRMKDLCAMYNCEEVPTQGDGNSQFKALSLGLYEREDRHVEVRANIVQHLRENSERYFQFVENGEVFADYVNRISQDGQWGDEVTLRAFEQCNGRGVRVLSDNEQNPVINPTFEGPLEDTITITHYGEVHYNGTKPIRA